MKLIHVLYRNGYSTWCGRSAKRTKWIKAEEATARKDELTCGACRALVTVGWLDKA